MADAQPVPRLVEPDGAGPVIAARDLIDFVYLEADLLDERRFDEWHSLFADDGRYWVPLRSSQPDATDHVSLACEDKLLLRARIERFSGDRTHSQQPESRCLHVLQRPVVVAIDEEKCEYATRTRFMYTETRGEEQVILACTAAHRLILLDEQLQILEKRVDTLNADAPLPMIQLFM